MAMPIYMDFSSLLALATLLTGIIWGIDALFFRPKRIARAPTGTLVSEPKMVEYSRAFFPILLIVCLLRSFVAEPFRIPTGSMKPELLEGDFILVNKFAYGLRLPVVGTKIYRVGEPQRGDIFIFRNPKDTSIDFVKRVVGLPGDKISYSKDKVLSINGKPVPQEFMGNATDIDISGRSYQVKLFKEDLPNKTHPIYLHPEMDAVVMNETEVPKGMYFAMGDNRDNSEDSRVWGFVPEELILGKAICVWMSWDSNHHDVRWRRIGHLVKNEK